MNGLVLAAIIAFVFVVACVCAVLPVYSATGFTVGTEMLVASLIVGFSLLGLFIVVFYALGRR
jgi:hypothetical protein